MRINKPWRPMRGVGVLGLALGLWLAPAWGQEPAKPHGSNAAAMEQAALGPHFRAGQVSRYALWTRRDQNTTMNVGDEMQSFDLRMEQEGQATWTCEKVNPDGSALCVMTLDFLVVTLTTPDGQIQRMDSRQASGENEMIQRLLQALVGVPMKVQVAPDGSVGSVSGLEAVRQRAGANLRVPDELDMAESASDLATLPGAPARGRLGQTWDVAFAWNHELGVMHTPVRYELTGIEEIAGIPLATVNASAKLRLEVDPAKLPTQGPQVDVRMTQGQFNTQVMFDLLRHEAVGRNTVQKTVIQARVSMEGRTMVRTVSETIHGQALRIAEQ